MSSADPTPAEAPAPSSTPPVDTTPAPSPPTKPPKSFGWSQAVTWIGVTAIVVSGLLALWVYQSLRQAPGEIAAAGRQVLADLGEVAAAFRTGTVTTQFVSHATEMAGTSYFQFATLRETELFQRTDEATVLWGNLDLPTVIVEATAPVEYTYYLDFAEPWELRQEGDQILVVAPPIRFNTPSVDASAIRYSVRAGSLLRDETTALAKLKSGITAMARMRARQNRELVREAGRRQTEKFVEQWLAGNFTDGTEYRARVLFADEVDDLKETKPPLVLPRRSDQ